MNNDLISREALKKAINENRWVNKYDFEKTVKLIDNAPTVDIKDEIAGAYNEGYMCGNKEAEKARPQGEWRLDDTEQFCYCSNCEDTYYPRPLDPSWHYCPHCGADMRKGGAE